MSWRRKKETDLVSSEQVQEKPFLNTNSSRNSYMSSFNRDFPALRFISVMLVIFGWLQVMGGLIAFCSGFVLKSRTMFGVQPPPNWSIIGGGVFVILGGLFVVAVGEIITVLLAIEENTRS